MDVEKPDALCPPDTGGLRIGPGCRLYHAERMGTCCTTRAMPPLRPGNLLHHPSDTGGGSFSGTAALPVIAPRRPRPPGPRPWPSPRPFPKRP